MKVIYKGKIDEYIIIMFVTNATIDSEATKKRIAPEITQEMSEEDIENLYMENLVYADVGSEADLVEDTYGDEIQKKLDAAKKNQLLLYSGKYICNYKGVKYWIKVLSKWKEEEINTIGVKLPTGAILQEDLSEEQRKEIASQRELDRIAGLTPEKKAEEKTIRLHSLAREAINKAEEAELLGEEFDKLAWLNPKKAEIEALYA